MSSLYNNSEYNNILYAGSTPTDAPFSSPPEYITLSSNINGGSSLSILIAGEVPLSVSILDSSSSYDLLRLSVIPGLGQVVFSGASQVDANMNRFISLAGSIAGGSTTEAGNLLLFDVTGSTNISANIQVDYEMYETIFSGSSNVTSVLKFGDAALKTLINANSKFKPTAKVDKEFIFNPAGSSTFDVNTIDVFTRLQLVDESIIGSSSLEGTNFVITKNLRTTINGSSNLSNTRLSRLTSFSDSLIIGQSDFKSVKKLGSWDFDGGKTRIVANLDAPETLNSIGSRRRVSYVFEVDIPRTNVSLIDEHYKIFRFYNSMAALGPTLEYVRRNAGRELDSYDVDSTSHRKWSSDEDLNEIKTGQRGIVQKNARDTFFGKDGYFGLYKGPNKP